MSNYYIDTSSPGSTGSKTYTNSGFQPIGVRFTVGSKTGATDNVIHQSVGMADDTGYVSYTSIYGDSSNFQTKTGNAANGKIISHWERVSGTLTEVIAGTFTAYTTTGVTVNLTAATASYTMQIEMWD